MIVLALAALLLGGPASDQQAQQTPPDQPPQTAPATPTEGKKGSKKPKDPNKPKKAKDPNSQKQAKKPKSEKPAPDEMDDPDAEPPPAGPGIGFSWNQHPTVHFGDLFRVSLEAKLQEDWHTSYPNAPGLYCTNDPLPSTCYWQLHRNRVGVKGNFTKHLTYEVERELTEQELTDKDILLGYTPKSVWKDVYVNLKVIKKVQLQAGKFKVPFGLDQTTGVSHNDYVYRSLGANYLAPGRDIGVMAHAHVMKRSLFYYVGVFEHDGDNAKSKKIHGGGTTFAARVTGVPFRRLHNPLLDAINVGTAYTTSSLSGDPYLPNGLRGRTVLTQDTFYSSVYVNGRRRRWEADVDWTVGSASLRSEYTWLTDDRIGQGLGDEDLPDARAQAWYVSGTYILTGERKRRPLRADGDFLRGGFGAVEAAARYERMWFDSPGGVGLDEPARTPRAINIYPSGDKALTLGINWALDRHFKIQWNSVREQVEDPARNPMKDGGAFWSHILRFQIVL